MHLLNHSLEAQPLTTYRDKKSTLEQFGNLLFMTSPTAICCAVTAMDKLTMSYKRLCHAKNEKFTADNIAYTQDVLDYVGSVPGSSVKFYDESGINILMCNSVYGHGERSKRTVEMVTDKEG